MHMQTVQLHDCKANAAVAAAEAAPISPVLLATRRPAPPHCPYRDGSAPATQRRLLASSSASSAAAPRLEDEVLDLRFATGNLTGSSTTSNPFHAGQIVKCSGPFISTGCPDGQYKPVSATALGQVDIWLFLIAIFHSFISGGCCQGLRKARLLLLPLLLLASNAPSACCDSTFICRLSVHHPCCLPALQCFPLWWPSCACASSGATGSTVQKGRRPRRKRRSRRLQQLEPRQPGLKLMLQTGQQARRRGPTALQRRRQLQQRQGRRRLWWRTISPKNPGLHPHLWYTTLPSTSTSISICNARGLCVLADGRVRLVSAFCRPSLPTQVREQAPSLRQPSAEDPCCYLLIPA
jgi:hypothetical protein